MDIINHVPCPGCNQETTLIIPVEENEWEDHCWTCSRLLEKSTIFHISRMADGALLWWHLPDVMVQRLYLAGQEEVCDE